VRGEGGRPAATRQSHLHLVLARECVAPTHLLFDITSARMSATPPGSHSSRSTVGRCALKMAERIWTAMVRSANGAAGYLTLWPKKHGALCM
jgi:hypothetical protein